MVYVSLTSFTFLILPTTDLPLFGFSFLPTPAFCKLLLCCAIASGCGTFEPPLVREYHISDAPRTFPALPFPLASAAVMLQGAEERSDELE